MENKGKLHEDFPSTFFREVVKTISWYFTDNFDRTVLYYNMEPLTVSLFNVLVKYDLMEFASSGFRLTKEGKLYFSFINL